MKDYRADFLSGQLLEKTAKTMLDSIDGTIVLAFINRSGGCFTNNEQTFEKVFADKLLLENLCAKIDDGGELLISKIGEYSVIGSSISAAGEGIGYMLFILPDCSPERALEYIDFIEMTSANGSTIASLLAASRRFSGMLVDAHSETIAASFAAVN